MFWNKKKKEKVEEVIQPSRLVFELQEDGTVVIACSWPKPYDGEEAAIITESFSTLIFLLTTGHMTPAIQKAISSFGGDKVTDGMAKSILNKIHILLTESGMGNLSVHSDRPIVTPSEVFQVRGNQ